MLDHASKCEPFVFKVDSTDPVLDGAVTGSFWDADMSGDDKTNEIAAEAMNTSIRLDFNEALDGSTVSRTDFEVDGDTPLDADHYADAPKSVFLTVGAMEPDATPEVDLVGEVSDIAGNIQNTGLVPAEETEDGIAPTLNVTITGESGEGRPVTDDAVTITIMANETTSPTVAITQIVNVDEDGNGLLAEGQNVAATPAVTTKSPGVYETTWDGANRDGLYNVYVTGRDSAGNTGTKGVSGLMTVSYEEDDPETEDVDESVTSSEDVLSPIDLSGETKAILFEVDTAGPEFELKPPTSDDPNSFVQIEFGEGSENPVGVLEPGKYPDDDGDDVDDMYFGGNSLGEDGDFDGTDDGTDPDMADLDTFGMVTIVSATLDGDDISGDLERLDSSNFLFVTPNLEVGEYAIEIKAEDDAGNSATTEQTLEITERVPFTLSLRAGVSVISFPGNPEDSDINEVFPLDHPAQQIATFDPTQPGRWFEAQRDPVTGLFAGTLMTISQNQAYLVRSDSSKALSVVISRPGAIDLVPPPSIDLVPGWNLMPVLDVTFELSAGDKISADNYFGATALGDDPPIQRIFAVDTITRRLVVVNPETNHLEVGRGYWVFANETVSFAPGAAD